MPRPPSHISSLHIPHTPNHESGIAELCMHASQCSPFTQCFHQYPYCPVYIPRPVSPIFLVPYRPYCPHRLIPHIPRGKWRQRISMEIWAGGLDGWILAKVKVSVSVPVPVSVNINLRCGTRCKWQINQRPQDSGGKGTRHKGWWDDMRLEEVSWSSPPHIPHIPLHASCRFPMPCFRPFPNNPTYISIHTAQMVHAGQPVLVLIPSGSVCIPTVECSISPLSIYILTWSRSHASRELIEITFDYSYAGRPVYL